MKKWLYLVLPVVMAAIFTVFYIQHDKETVVREQTRAEKKAQEVAAEKAVKGAAEAKAKESAKIAQDERDKENADRERTRKVQQDAVDKEIKDTTDRALAEADASARKAKQLDADLERLQRDKERVTREAFDLAKQVELAMVAKRTI